MSDSGNGRTPSSVRAIDHIDAARQRVVGAGGEAFAGPLLLPGLESGDGNKWLYTQAPWGSVIELITYLSAQPYEELTSPPLRRWRPAPAV